MNAPRSFPVTVEVLALGIGLLVSGWMSYKCLIYTVAFSTPLSTELLHSTAWYAGTLNTIVVILTLLFPVLPVALYIGWFIDQMNR